MEAVVVGAGVAGLTCAVELAERGVRVEVIDRAPAFGPASCSWYAGGMLAPRCECESAPELIATLGLEGIAWWQHQLATARLGCADTPDESASLVRAGTLVIAHGRDRGELAHFARRTQGFERLDRQALATLEPDLAERFDQALYFPEEAHLDPREALRTLAQRLDALGVPVRWGVDVAGTVVRRGGGVVRIDSGACAVDVARASGNACDIDDARVGSEARGIDDARDSGGDFGINPVRVGGTGRWVIDCTGLAARKVLTDLRGVKGEMVVLRVREHEVKLTRPVRVLHPRVPVYIVPRAHGHYMIGATMIESDEGSRITARSMLELLSAAYALHPAFGEAEIVETGVQVRPAFPDNLPRIRQRGRTVYVNGLFRHGFLIAPALARRVARLVLHGEPFPEVMDEAGGHG